MVCGGKGCGKVEYLIPDGRMDKEILVVLESLSQLKITQNETFIVLVELASYLFLLALDLVLAAVLVLISDILELEYISVLSMSE